MSEIVPLAPRHSLDLAVLHLSHLPTPFKGAPGKHLLSVYYKAVASGRGAAGYVAEDRDQVLGYVCGVWEPAELRATLLKSQWSSLALWAPASVLIQPQLVLSFVQRLGSSSEESAREADEGYELRPIVVDPVARGTGLASRLVDRLISDARNRGFDRIHLFTEIDNQRAQAFYEKMGFMSMGQIQHDGGSVVRYERSLTGA